MRRKFLISVISVLCALMCALCLFACGGKTPVTPETPDKPNDLDSPSVVEVEDMQIDKFISEHLTTAQDFVLFIRPSVVGQKEVKAENWTIKADSKNISLEQVNIAYTYVVNKTDRQVEIASVTLGEPAKFDDIVKGRTVNADTLDIDRTAVFNFNAKTNYNKQDLSSALFETARLDTTDLYPNTIYKEVQSTNDNYRSFELLSQSDNKIIIKQVTAEKMDGTDAGLIKRLDGPRTTLSTKATYEIEGSNIYNSVYELENLGPEQENPDTPDIPVDPTPGDEVTAQEIIEALDKNCSAGIYEECFIFDVNKDNVTNENWYVTKDSDGKITKAEYSFNCLRSQTSAYYTVATVNFGYPVSAKDLKDGNLGRVTYSSSYTFNYDPTIQEARAELTNAICDKVFGENESATRFIVEQGAVGGAYKGFKIVEINKESINEAVVTIKLCSNDEEYIKNISSLKVIYQNAYEISGEKVEESKTTEAKTTAYKYIVTFDNDDEICPAVGTSECRFCQ